MSWSGLGVVGAILMFLTSLIFFVAAFYGPPGRATPEVLEVSAIVGILLFFNSVILFAFSLGIITP